MFDTEIVKKQVIALMGLSVRNANTNISEYSTILGDTTYAAAEIDRAANSSTFLIMQAICETDGHGERGAFQTATVLMHSSALPRHYGSIGVPRITPFIGAGYVITGKRKSIEEINAYRHNPDNFYSLTAHNASLSNLHSKLAGFYAIDNNTFYFTGYSAVSDLAVFTAASSTLIPDNRYQLAIDLTIAKLRKDGDISDIFGYYAAQGFGEIERIKQLAKQPPSLLKTVGNRDSGTK